MYWSQTSNWETENVCCELERSWRDMELEKNEKSVTDAIVRGLPVTNKFARLKGLREWEMVTRLIKMELSTQL